MTTDKETTTELAEEPMPDLRLQVQALQHLRKNHAGIVTWGEFVRPLRSVYVHLTCGAMTEIGVQYSELFARNPTWSPSAYCCSCKEFLPVDEFAWVDDHGVSTGETVGS